MIELINVELSDSAQECDATVNAERFQSWVHRKIIQTITDKRYGRSKRERPV